MWNSAFIHSLCLLKLLVDVLGFRRAAGKLWVSLLHAESRILHVYRWELHSQINTLLVAMVMKTHSEQLSHSQNAQISVFRHPLQHTDPVQAWKKRQEQGFKIIWQTMQGTCFNPPQKHSKIPPVKYIKPNLLSRCSSFRQSTLNSFQVSLQTMLHLLVYSFLSWGLLTCVRINLAAL